MTDATARRGPYAKGVAKREEILERALDVIARAGVAGASVKELADAVGLSQAGLLHYFDSREELFTAILRKRDELDRHVADLEAAESLDDLRAGFLRIVQRNTERPGVVELFSRLAVDAASPAHPAHAYFRERSRGLREGLAAGFAAAQRAGSIPASLDPETLARVVQAASDGLQLQWLQEPDVDMSAAMDALFASLARE